MLAAALILPTLLTGGAQPPQGALTLAEPRVQYRPNEASATTSPWIDANGWRILRSPGAPFVYNVKGETAALAAAEAFTYHARAFVSADESGASVFNRMLAFLKDVPASDLSPVADFGIVDDGSGIAGELLNVLGRMNLLYQVEKSPSPGFRLNVQLGTKEYPREEAKDPGFLAHKIRSQLGDDQRSLRIYGSEVVLGRLETGAHKGRVYLLNYSNRVVLGLRVRVRRAFAKGDLRAYGVQNARLADWAQDGPATEFTIPELRNYAVIDLSM